MTHAAGGCLCKAVRFELRSAPFDAGWCHCRTCQLNSGAPAMAFASVPAGDWLVTRGENHVRRTRSSSFASRLFCDRCGTPLGLDYDTQTETFDFSIATLDDPGLIAPGFHIFWDSRVPWFDPQDGLPRFDRFRPGMEPPQ